MEKLFLSSQDPWDLGYLFSGSWAALLTNKMHDWGHSPGLHELQPVGAKEEVVGTCLLRPEEGVLGSTDHQHSHPGL